MKSRVSAEAEDIKAASAIVRRPPLAGCRQLLRVIAEDWSASSGKLQTFRRDADGPWQLDGEPLDVRLGQSGLAWGIGRHPPIPDTSPRKQEGDRRTPAGLFDLSLVFGEAEESDVAVRRLRMPYRTTREHCLYVDDPASRHYNQWVDRRHVAVDWQSAETLRRADERYHWGVVVEHNPPPAIPGAGSCIFIHLWDDARAGTAGCTAMARDDLLRLLHWLDATAVPCLAVLPRLDYQRYAADWDLPSL